MLRLEAAHQRVARPTGDLEGVVRFYRDGLGFEVLSRFEGHEGSDGVMLGRTGAGYHLEFTRMTGAPAPRAPGKTFEDPDGYRVVLQNQEWAP